MRKIREFKLHLHFKEIRRRARKALDMAAAGIQDDAGLQSVLDAVATTARPAVLFNSFGPESEDTTALSPIPGLAHTLGLSTLGAALEALMAEAQMAGPQRKKLFELVAAAALEQTVQFVIALLKDEVEAERCELSPIEYLNDPAALQAVIAKLQGEKIGLELKEGALAPRHSAAFCLSWIARRSRSRAKTQASGRKK